MTSVTESDAISTGSGPSLDRLAAADPVRRVVGRNVSKADVLFYRLGASRVALKTYEPRPFWARQIVGRWFVRRETAAFEAARGVPGLPSYLGRVGPYAFATEWVDAEPLATRSRDEVEAGVFDAVEATVDALHARGIALGDLHHRDVLLGDGGAVFVVDLATAWVLGERPGRLRRAVFERLRDADRLSLARLRARFTGGDEHAVAGSAGAAVAARHARVRRLKNLWDRVRGKHRRTRK
jgi:hypothetical protein